MCGVAAGPFVVRILQRRVSSIRQLGLFERADQIAGIAGWFVPFSGPSFHK
jgi:hypothetical protein